MYMAAVAGAGPTGITVAKRLQEKGWQTVLMEEHSKIGNPVACTGLVSTTGVQDLGIRKEVEEVLMNKVRGAQFFAPNGEMIEIKRSETTAFVIDRGEFDRVLGRGAKEAGVEIRLDTKLIDVRKETIFVEHKGRGELIKSKLVVGADGVNSKTRRVIGLNTDIKNFVHAYQMDVSGNFDPKMVQLYFGDFAKNFFAWVVPENEERARVGLASTSGNIRQDFEKFTQTHNITGKLCDMCSKLIPVGEPLRGIVKDNIVLVGDAAFQTKATTGGGILLGMQASEICAGSVHKHFADKEPLENYEKNMAEINHELMLHWKIRQFMSNKSEPELNNLFTRMNKAKIGEFLANYGDMDRPSRFVGRAMASPSLWRLFPEAVKFMMT